MYSTRAAILCIHGASKQYIHFWTDISSSALVRYLFVNEHEEAPILRNEFRWNMGANQSSDGGSRGGAQTNNGGVETCCYELLGVDRQATDEE